MSGSFHRNVGIGGPARDDHAGDPDSVPAEADLVERTSCLLVTAALPVWSVRPAATGMDPNGMSFMMHSCPPLY